MLSRRTLIYFQRSSPSTILRSTLQSQSSLVTSSPRTFKNSAIRSDAVVAPAPARRPVGAFRGGLFGFLFGSVLSGAGMYYYILEEYRVSNELLTEDIFALQAAVQRIESYTKNLEAQVNDMQKKKTI